MHRGKFVGLIEWFELCGALYQSRGNGCIRVDAPHAALPGECRDGQHGRLVKAPGSGLQYACEGALVILKMLDQHQVGEVAERTINGRIGSRCLAITDGFDMALVRQCFVLERIMGEVGIFPEGNETQAIG